MKEPRENIFVLWVRKTGEKDSDGKREREIIEKDRERLRVTNRDSEN